MHARVGAVSVVLFVFALLAGCHLKGKSGGGATATATPTPAPTPTTVAGGPTLPIGVNLEGLADYSTSLVFVDVVKSSRPWGTVACPYCGGDLSNPSGSAPVDANGWPTADFGAFFFTGVPNAAGTYSLSFTGQAQINPDASSSSVNVTDPTDGSATTNGHYDAGSNTTTAHVTLGVNADPSCAQHDINYVQNCQDQLVLTFTQTKRTGASAAGTGLTNVRLLRPGYAFNTTQTFHTAFTNKLAPFAVLRFMDLLATNNNPIAHFSARTRKTDAQQTTVLPQTGGGGGTEKGLAWEYVVQLANETGKDAWINIPALADDDYVTQVATLIKGSLDASRVVYVEYSNEVWNSVFDQSDQDNTAAQAEITAAATTPDPVCVAKGLTGSPLKDCNVNDGSDPNSAYGNTTYQMWRRVPKRLIEIAKIFESVFGAGSINTRIRPVLASQIGWDYVLYQQLRFVEKYYPPVNKYLYAIAGAPYFNISSLPAGTTTATPQDIANALNTNVTKYIDNKTFKRDPAYIAGCTGGVNGNPLGPDTVPTYNTLAHCYGVKSFGYEGGPDTTYGTITGSSDNLTSIILSQHKSSLAPNVGDILKRYLGAWYGCGNDLFMYFSFGASDGQYGTWGLYTDVSLDAATQGAQDNADSPLKPKALIDFLANPTPSEACP